MVCNSNADGINNVSTIEMATGAPNAILAINSLDRYTDTVIRRTTRIRATFAAAATVMTLAPPPFQTEQPVVGALLTSFSGIQKDTFILSVVGDQITISKPTLNAAVNPRLMFQRYTVESSLSPINTGLYGAYNNILPYSYKFELFRPNALIYGYIQRLVISQLQLQYNIPTVALGRNDKFYIYINSPVSYNPITIPYGFYTPQELAAVLDTLITPIIADISVTWDNRTGFNFTSASTVFMFPPPDNIDPLLSEQEKNVVYRAYRLLGMNQKANASVFPPLNTQISGDYPNFLYTPYIDFYSDVLSNYQTIKDTSTYTSTRKGLICRAYVSGVGAPVETGLQTALGSSSFVITLDLNSPKIIRWTPDVAPPSIDFQLRDCYDDFIPGAEEGFETEWQMTLLCVEGREWNS